MINPEEYIPMKDVAKLAGVSQTTIRNWDLNGKLKAYRHPITNRRLYKREQIEKIMHLKGEGLGEI